MGFGQPFFDCNLTCLRHGLKEKTAQDVYLTILWVKRLLDTLAILNDLDFLFDE